MSNVGSGAAVGSPASSGVLVPILSGAVLALVAGSLYFYYQLVQMRHDLDQLRNESVRVRSELAQTRSQLLAEIAKQYEASTVSTKTSQSTVDLLKSELQAARQQARTLVGKAQSDAKQRVEDIASRLDTLQQEQSQKLTAVRDAVSEVRTDADATKTRVGEVSKEVGTVKTDLTATKSELQKTIAELRSATGDLGVQSGLIATNAKELAALKLLNERDYAEFSLAKEKNPRKIGDIQIRLTSADPKKNRYTLEVMVDDKKVQKKDKTANEPVQFILSGTSQPYELVVNEIKKDVIVGYLAAPKVHSPRN